MSSDNSEKKEQQQQQAATTPPPAAPPVKPPKPPKPLFTPHENGRDMMLCSPAFGALWLDPEHCVVGGGGGGKKYELPNTIILMKVSQNRKSQPTENDMFGEVIASLDFEEAGTIQTVSDTCIRAGNGAAFFIASHIDAFSLIKYDPSSATPSSSKLRTICRVALNTAAINADTKPISLVNLPKEAGGPLIFAGQDNQTIAVFRLSTLLQWSDRETALKSTENIPVAKTVEDVKNLALSVCDFPTGGRLCDLKTKVIPTTLPETSTDLCITIAICTRDKTLLVGHFDQDARKFIPAKKFTAEDFGFTKEFVTKNEPKGGKDIPFPVMLTGKSIRTCQFSPYPVNRHFAVDDAGKFTGVSTDLFVALQPHKMSVCAARIRIESKKSSIETLSVSVEELVKSGSSEPPSTSVMLPLRQNGDRQSVRDDVFCVATVEGSLLEFVFSSSGGNNGMIRRIISGFHYDAVTSISLAPTPMNNNNCKVIPVISTDIARRIAFHFLEPFSRTTSTVTTESLAKVTKPPNMFNTELTSMALAKKRKQTMMRFVLFSVLMVILALTIKFVMGFF